MNTNGVISSAAAVLLSVVMLASCRSDGLGKSVEADPAAGAAEAAAASTVPDAAATPSEADLALAGRVERAIEAAWQTPAREMANMVHAGWQRSRLEQLRGNQPATAEQLAAARTVLTASLKVLERGPDWPRPQPITVPRAAQPPVIDGQLDDPAWRSAATFTETYPFNETDAVEQPATTWYITWDQTHLYFAFRCSDTSIIAPGVERDGAVYAYDCVEAFILPEPRLGLYWEIVVSPTGSLFDALHAKKFEDWGPLARADEDVQDLQIGLSIAGTANDDSDVDEGYSVELAVPFRELPTYTRGNEPQVGDVLHAMLVRLDVNAPDGKGLKAYAFKPLLNWGHNVWNHWPLVLGE